MPYDSVKGVRELRQRRRAAGLCTDCGCPALPGRPVCDPCAEYRRAHGKVAYKRLKDEGEITRRTQRDISAIRAEVLNAYGGRCACCGESHLHFLTLDHTNNDGKQHRQTTMGRRIAGWVFYRKMRALGYPPGLRVLCYNCNFARGHHGFCPHETALITG